MQHVYLSELLCLLMFAVSGMDIFVRIRGVPHPLQLEIDSTVKDVYRGTGELTKNGNFVLMHGGKELEENDVSIADVGICSEGTIDCVMWESDDFERFNRLWPAANRKDVWNWITDDEHSSYAEFAKKHSYNLRQMFEYKWYDECFCLFKYDAIKLRLTEIDIYELVGYVVEQSVPFTCLYLNVLGEMTELKKLTIGGFASKKNINLVFPTLMHSKLTMIDITLLECMDLDYSNLSQSVIIDGKVHKRELYVNQVNVFSDIQKKNTSITIDDVAKSANSHEEKTKDNESSYRCKSLASVQIIIVCIVMLYNL